MRFSGLRTTIYLAVSTSFCRDYSVVAGSWRRNQPKPSRMMDEKNLSFHSLFQDESSNTTTSTKHIDDSYYYTQSRNRNRKRPLLKDRYNMPKHDKKSLQPGADGCEQRYKALGILFCEKSRDGGTNARTYKSSERKKAAKRPKNAMMKSTPGRRPKGKGSDESKQKPDRTKRPAQSQRPTWLSTGPPSILSTSTSFPSPSASIPKSLPPSASIPSIFPTRRPTSLGNETFPPTTISSTDQNNTTTLVPSFVSSLVTFSPNVTGRPSVSPTTSSPTIQMGTDPPMLGSSPPTSAHSDSLKPTNANHSSMSPTNYISSTPPAHSPIPSTIIPTKVPSSIPNDTLNRRSTPFSVGYVVESGPNTTKSNFDFAQEVTLQFLNDYLFGQFSASDVTILAMYLGLVQGINETSPSQPEAIYEVELVFADASLYIPSQQEIDVLIEISFSEPFLSDLQSKLQNLPAQNPFSDTETIVFTFRDDLDVSRSSWDGVEVRSTYRLPQAGNKLFNTAAPFFTVPGGTTVSMQLTPFSLTFETSQDSYPTTDQTQATVGITLTFLDKHFRATLESVESGSYLLLSGSGATAKNDPRKVSFMGEVEMRQIPSFSVTKEELDLVVELSFSSASVGEFLHLLQSLPDDNPYSTTTSIKYVKASSHIPDTVAAAPTGTSGGSPNLSAVSIAALIVGCVAGLALIALLKRIVFKRTPSLQRNDLRASLSEDEALVEIISESRSASTLRSMTLAGGVLEERGIFLEENPEGEDEEEHSIEFYYDHSVENERFQDPLFQSPFRNYGADVVAAWRR